MTPTLDSTISIVEKTEDSIVYKSATGEIWEIIGTCNACGECEVGAVDNYLATELDSRGRATVLKYQIWTGIPVGQAGACLDTRFGKRLDIPVRPELTQKLKHCVLSGRYLNGN